MSSFMIDKDINEFQKSVQNLGVGIGRAGSLWKDPKFSELSAAVGIIANMSRDVILAGDRCRTAVSRFDQIASEEY